MISHPAYLLIRYQLSFIRNKLIGNIALKEFNLEYNKNDTSYVGPGNIFTYNENLYIVSYQTQKPSNRSKKKKTDTFFNSIRLK
jgi:hypothetical protein